MSKLRKGKGEELKTYCGTVDFISPEIAQNKSYNEATDIWSLGVIAFMILSGIPPFFANDDKAILRNIKSCNYDFDSDIWNEISEDAKSWIDQILEVKPEKRLDSDQSMQHPWIA